MAHPQLHKSLVEGQRDDVVVVVTRNEHSTEDRFKVGPLADTSSLEIAQPQLLVGESRLLTVGIKNVERRMITLVNRTSCHV